jgi:hypothetical protein
MIRFLILTVMLVTCEGALACPMCKDSASNQEGAAVQMHDAYSSSGENISGGLNTSIYVMFACLLGVGGMVTTVMVKGMKSAPGGRNGTEQDTKRD